MIITLTPNPSLDHTLELTDLLKPGTVQRAHSVTTEPGGKGVNIARTLHTNNIPCHTILPGSPTDPHLSALTEQRLPWTSTPLLTPIRSNLTITDPTGKTTKINEPGHQLTPAHIAALTELSLKQAAGASWFVMAGSLPPGTPATFYRDLILTLRERLGPAAPKTAVDTSGEPLRLAVEAEPDLIKPNTEELAELLGCTGAAEELETAPSLVAALAHHLTDRVDTVLASLGANGAALITADEAWYAPAPHIHARSTVGAGDAALTGYLIAETAGKPHPECLRQAVALGSAAAALPGSAMPHLDYAPKDHIHPRPLAHYDNPESVTDPRNTA